jgi:Fe-Mn family superoxide dismutase
MSSTLLTSALTSLLKASPSLATAVPRAFSSVVAGGSFKLPDLPYDYAALEPAISGEIMRIHHTKHHNAYVTNLNIALEKYSKASAAGNLAEMIALQPALRFNGGGHINHSIFWENLAPAGRGGGGEPVGDLAKLVAEQFGTFAALKTAMNAGGAGVQGSGWVWLGYRKATGRVEVAACANQDPLHATGLVPLIGIDVWEHACAWGVAGARARARRPRTPRRSTHRLATHTTSPARATCRLPAVQEHAPRLPQCHLERHQLGRRREAPAGGKDGLGGEKKNAQMALDTTFFSAPLSWR